jgi:hypothetical protein
MVAELDKSCQAQCHVHIDETSSGNLLFYYYPTPTGGRLY